ncbi:MAG: SDR family oxidoreductase [Saprospiraceae bacterium]
MKTVLVTGASGFLGWNVSRYCPPGWHIVGTYHQHREGLFPKAEYVQLNMTNKDQIWHVLKSVKPDAVFHLAACSHTNYCEEKPDETYPLNVTATAGLAEMCADLHLRLVFTSSEQVFDGSSDAYFEADAPCPRNEYGRQKSEAETRLTAIYPEAAIARISVLYGVASPVAPSFLQQWLDAWQKFFPVTAFHDEFRNFLSSASAVDGLFTLLNQDASGIFHLGGANYLSRYDFALMTRDVFQLPVAPIESRSQQEVDMPAFRPPRLLLKTTKMTDIGFRPRHARDELQHLAKEILLPPPFSEN